VWFHLTKDQFDYFVDHAYGKGATGRQNFKDFALVPHTWLRLSVEPQLMQQKVSVGFDVLLSDGTRRALAKAPASILAGSSFQALVDRNMGSMTLAEKNLPGSSQPWRVPFYYDHPDGGGVVQVIAQGEKGNFTIAYSVESPRHALSDVPFVAYLPVNLPPPDPNAKACDMLGDPNIHLSPMGTFHMEFIVSDVIREASDRRPLRGDILCSIFHANDVTVTGPKPDVLSVSDFSIAGADFEAAKPISYDSKELYAGEYQILCAQDTDQDGKASLGDPVTLPIGGFPIACNVNPVTVEFAILDPQP
jgi:uncharacterized protein (DUF2141 family)